MRKREQGKSDKAHALPGYRMWKGHSRCYTPRPGQGVNSRGLSAAIIKYQASDVKKAVSIASVFSQGGMRGGAGYDELPVATVSTPQVAALHHFARPLAAGARPHRATGSVA